MAKQIAVIKTIELGIYRYWLLKSKGLKPFAFSQLYKIKPFTEENSLFR